MLGHHSFIGRFFISDKNLFLIRGVRSICAHVSWIDINSFSLLTRAVDFSDRPQPSVSISVMFSLVYFSRIHPTCTFRSFFWGSTRNHFLEVCSHLFTAHPGHAWAWALLSAWWNQPSLNTRHTPHPIH